MTRSYPAAHESLLGSVPREGTRNAAFHAPGKEGRSMRIRATAALIALAGVVASAGGAAAADTASATSPAVRRAIVAAVERDRKIYGGRTPVPGVLIAVWDGKGGSYVRAFGYANATQRVRLSAADHF